MNNTFRPERAVVSIGELFVHLGRRGFPGRGREKSRAEEPALTTPAIHVSCLTVSSVVPG